MKPFVHSILVATLWVALSPSACSSDATPSPTGDADASSQADTSATDGAASLDASTDDASTTDAKRAACNALVNSASEALAGTVKGTAPAPTGGTIVDGTYVLTEFTVYDPNGTAQAPSPSGLRVTLVITGNLMESIQSLPGGSTDTFAETFVVVGVDINRTLTCPKPGPDLKAVYSVGANSLTLYETDPSSKLVAGSVYTKK